MIVVALAVVLAGGVVLARTLLASPAAPPGEAATIWTSPASAPVLLAEPNGSGDYDPWAIDAGDAFVVLQAENSSEYESVRSVAGLDAATGARRWQVPLPAARCATTVVTISQVGPGIACAGADRLVLIAVASGEVVHESAIEEAPSYIAAGQAGIITIGGTDPDTGSTIVSWYGLDAAPGWRSDLAQADPVFLENLFRGSDGELTAGGFAVADVTSALLVEHEGRAVRADASGLGDPVRCESVAVDPRGYTCATFLEHTIRYDLTGAVQWEENVNLVRSNDFQLPVTVTDPDYQPDAETVNAFDAVTGRIGREILEPERAELLILRSQTVPLMSGRDRMIMLSARGDAELWQRSVDWSNAFVTILPERIVVEEGSGEALVLDAATGEGIAMVDVPPMCTPAGERQLLCSDFDVLRLIELP